MKCRKMVVCLVGSLSLLPAVGTAVSDDNPYKSIVSRNPFALTPPPPPPPPQPATPPANIKLTGITTILGTKRALFMVQEGGQKTEQSYILREGQREGQIQVLEIDDKGGSVKVKNADVVSVLSFDKDGIKLPGAPVSTPPPPPAAGSFGTVRTGGTQPNPGAPNPGTGLRQIPTRQLRMPRSQSTQSQVPDPSPQAVAQMIAMETHAVEKKAEIDSGQYPPLPPTELRPHFQDSEQSESGLPFNGPPSPMPPSPR